MDTPLSATELPDLVSWCARMYADVHCTPYNVRRILHGLGCTAYSVRRTVYGMSMVVSGLVVYVHRGSLRGVRGRVRWL